MLGPESPGGIWPAVGTQVDDIEAMMLTIDSAEPLAVVAVPLTAMPLGFSAGPVDMYWKR